MYPFNIVVHKFAQLVDVLLVLGGDENGVLAVLGKPDVLQHLKGVVSFGPWRKVVGGLLLESIGIGLVEDHQRGLVVGAYLGKGFIHLVYLFLVVAMRYLRFMELQRAGHD